MSKGRRNIFVLVLVAGLLLGSGAAIFNKPTKLGLDLKGGVELVYQGKPTAEAKVTSESIDRAIEIIRKRVDVLGVSEPEIQRSGADQITVSLPDVKNAERAEKQVGKTAQLYFYDWERNVSGNPERPIAGLYEAVDRAAKRKAASYGTTTGKQYYLFNKKSGKLLAGPDTSRLDLLAESDDQIPAGAEIKTVQRGTSVVRAEKAEKAKRQPDRWFILNDRPELKGTDIKRPKQETDQTSGQPNVTFSFTGDGREKFQRVTRRIALRGQLHQIPGQSAVESADHFAIVLDREVVTRPYIDFNENPDGIDGRTGAQISGSFTIESAQELAKFLEIGALPIDLKLISQRQVSATLGKQALDQGLLASMVGLLLVLFYLILSYRMLGLVASLALVIYAIFFFAIAKLIPITLTLPGIAGVILTIGVAADANVVIFERIKEEVRAGRSIPASIAAGYTKGFRTIVDGNMVTIITAFILFILATSSVKGFAVVLGLGTIISMFTAVLATQAVLGSLGRSRTLSRPSMLGAGKERVRWHMDFMGSSRWFFSMSGAILAVGAISFATKGINAGLDFQGGTRVTASLERSSDEGKVRQALGDLGLRDLKVQRVNDRELGKSVFQVSTRQLKTTQVGQIRTVLAKDFGVKRNGFSSESVGPIFGQEVKNSAIYALIFSLLAVIIYVTWRFQFKFAVPAIIALVHDLLIAFGFYSLTGRTVTTATVAALLTILGYSLYDTVIVFDRVRENVPRMPTAAFSQIVNRSMSEVLTRSLNTSFVTLLPVFMLLLFGGETLKDFAFALLVGIVSGAYSSIFIASPVLTAWKEREPLYRRRRARIAELHGGIVPAFVEAGAGAGVLRLDESRAPESEPITADEPPMAAEPETAMESSPGPTPEQPGPATVPGQAESSSDVDTATERTADRRRRRARRKKHGRQ